MTTLRPTWTSALFGALLVSVAGTALAHHEADLTMDEPMAVGGITTLCTGAGENVRDDVRMQDYALRVEVAGAGGQYLGDQIVEISGANLDEPIRVFCKAPWVLFQVADGQYNVSTWLGHDSLPKTAAIFVGGPGQTNIVMSFPNEGGAIRRVAQLD